MNVEYLFNKMRTAPVGFGIDETEVWLSDIPEIKSFSEIEKILSLEKLSRTEIRALIVIIRRKYIDSVDIENLFEGNYENYSTHNKIFDSYDGLFFFGDTSQTMNFRSLDKKLLKLKMCGTRKLSKIILPLNSSLEALDISYTPKLTHIENIESIDGLKFLFFNKCNRFLDFKFIEKLNNLQVLGISGTKALPELDFLSEKSNISILHLVETNAMKLKNTIDNLSKLKKLKSLSIEANQKELRQLREHLPKCVVNGFTLDEALKAGL